MRIRPQATREQRDAMLRLMARIQHPEGALEFVRKRDLDRRHVVTFSPAWETLPAADLADWVRDCGRPVRLGLQLHKVLWGDVPGR